MNGKTEITNKDEVKKLETDLFKLAEETDVKNVPFYEPIQSRKLLSGIEKITSALSHLHKNDKAIYKSPDEEYIKMNVEFKIVPEKVEELLTQETMESTAPMILKIKKPDYLGESQWEFRHETSPFQQKS